MKYTHRNQRNSIVAVLSAVILHAFILTASGQHAQSIYAVPLRLTGWNADFVSENTASHYSSPWDYSVLWTRPGFKHCLFETGLEGHMDGLLSSRQFLSDVDGGVLFQMELYDTNNVLCLRGDGSPQQRQGVLILLEPGKYSRLFVLATSQSATVSTYLDLVLTFADGTVNSPIEILARNWWVGTNQWSGDFPRRPAITRLGANDVSGSAFSYVNGASYGFELHQTDIDLATLGLDDNVLTGMSYSRSSGDPETAIVLAVSGEPNFKGHPVDLEKDLIAYYPFNNNLKDESGHSLDGAPLGQCNFTADRFGTPTKSNERFPKTRPVLRSRTIHASD